MAFEQFEVVVVKEEANHFEDPKTDNSDPDTGLLRNIKKEITVPKTVEADAPPSPDSSDTGRSWHVPVKQEVTEGYFEVTIKEEAQDSDNEDPVSEDPDNPAENTIIPTDIHDLENTQSASGIDCEFCGINFKNSRDLQKHIIVHTKHPVQCEHCNIRFINKMLLERHIIRRHSKNKDDPDKKPFQCPACSSRFTYSTNLVRHQERCKKQTEEPLICPFCSKVFEKRFLLTSHLRKHDTERPFGCDECTLTFKHKSTLIRHTHVHTGIRPYSCQYCGKTFTSSGLLKPHLRVHTGEKPFSCEFCNKKFAHKHNMQRHLVSHEKVKHTVCDICHKKFPRESRLKYHMKTHVNEKYFLCHVCPKRFSHKQNVLRHYMRKHPGHTYDCKETDASVATKLWDTMKKRFSGDETEEILG